MSDAHEMSGHQHDELPAPELQHLEPHEHHSSHHERDRERHQRVFTLDQFYAMQKIAQDVANQQFKRAVIVTSNLIVSAVALLASAAGLVTALAWNKAISDWLPTASPFSIHDRLVKEFAYAGAVTLFVIIAVGVLGYVTSRIKGDNLLDL
jgi:hypothetical protein